MKKLSIGGPVFQSMILGFLTSFVFARTDVTLLVGSDLHWDSTSTR